MLEGLSVGLALSHAANLDILDGTRDRLSQVAFLEPGSHSIHDPYPQRRIRELFTRAQSFHAFVVCVLYIFLDLYCLIIVMGVVVVTTLYPFSRLLRVQPVGVACANIIRGLQPFSHIYVLENVKNL